MTSTLSTVSDSGVAAPTVKRVVKDTGAGSLGSGACKQEDGRSVSEPQLEQQ